MAILKANGYGFDAPPTVQHAGIQVVQRVVVKFPSAVTLATNDVLLLAGLPQGYILDDVKIDIDTTITGAAANVGVLNEAETAVEHLSISTGSLANAGIVRTNSAKAVRQGRFEGKRTIGAVITASGNVTAGLELGFTITYRNAQFNE